MGFISRILGLERKGQIKEGTKNFEVLKNTYAIFKEILDLNNKALAIVGDLEEKATGEYIFDINYIKKSIDKLIPMMEKFCNDFDTLSGTDSNALARHLLEISARIKDILGFKATITDKYTVPLNEINAASAGYTGGKNANLGELTGIGGINVPEGFAITTLSFTEFIGYNKISAQIAKMLESADKKDFGELTEISGKIRNLILESEMPGSIYDDILCAFDNTFQDSGPGIRVSVRSSAVGEDSKFSFAGQYKTVLNVGRSSVIGAYKEVAAGRFNPKALYYCLSHGLDESELLMAACCIRQIDSVKSGVVYTQDPSGERDGIMLINSVWGQGKLLVDGSESPEIISYSKNDGKISGRIRARQENKLMAGDSGIMNIIELTNEEKLSEILSTREIDTLAQAAILIEQHFNCPQDIEWAIDKSGKLQILQARELKVIPKINYKMPDTSGYTIITEGGLSACPGAASGVVKHINNQNEIPGLPERPVIVAENPIPGLIAAISNAAAFVCGTASLASHLVTIAREYGIPTVVGLKDISTLENGSIVTVDAVNGIIYKGEITELTEALQPDTTLAEEIYTLGVLKRINTHIVPLNLKDTNSTGFSAESCRTYHDILRYVHQKSIEIMFDKARRLSLLSSNKLKLKSGIPLKIDIIYLDKSPGELKAVDENKIESQPLDSFWKGVMHEGWTIPPAMQDMKGLLSVMATDMASQKLNKLNEKSFAVAADEFMILSLRMGYHFSTIESFAGDENSKNYIKMRYMEGGATMERRNRRIGIIAEILAGYGFLSDVRGDYLEVSLSYESKEHTLRKLFILGRLTMLTKQLDMALKDDEAAEDYKIEIKEKLNSINSN